MAEARLPLLAHTGGEHTVPEVNPALADPRLLGLPLECGVTVIAAHCGTKSGVFDPDYFDAWAEMLREFPNLYGDISALVSLNRSGHLRDCLRDEIEPRILHGSDFPVPVLGTSALAARVDRPRRLFGGAREFRIRSSAIGSLSWRSGLRRRSRREQRRSCGSEVRQAIEWTGLMGF